MSFTLAMQRPLDFERLSSESQWAIDKALGILDWDGEDCRAPTENWKTYTRKYFPEKAEEIIVRHEKK